MDEESTSDTIVITARHFETNRTHVLSVWTGEYETVRQAYEQEIEALGKIPKFTNM